MMQKARFLAPKTRHVDRVSDRDVPDVWRGSRARILKEARGVDPG